MRQTTDRLCTRRGLKTSSPRTNGSSVSGWRGVRRTSPRVQRRHHRTQCGTRVGSIRGSCSHGAHRCSPSGQWPASVTPLAFLSSPAEEAARTALREHGPRLCAPVERGNPGAGTGNSGSGGVCCIPRAAEWAEWCLLNGPSGARPGALRNSGLHADHSKCGSIRRAPGELVRSPSGAEGERSRGGAR